MLRDGSEERRGYSPGRLFSDLPPRSGYEMARRVGIAPTSSGFGGPCIACLPPPYLENLRSTIQGHRDGHTTTHSPQSQATICRPLCPWMADRPRLRGDLPIKNEHRCHARDGAVSLHRWRRTRRCFTADVSVFMAHLPGKPFGSVKLGQKSPLFLASA